MINKLRLLIGKKIRNKPAYKEDLLSKLGRQQIKMMIDRGIELPIVPLK